MKKLIVKEVEVVVNDRTLDFTVNGLVVSLDRKIGESDYRLVYNYLKLKNPNKEKGNYSVGNFNYTITDNCVSISSKTYNFNNCIELTVEQLEHKNRHQLIRNLVINYLVNNIE